ncbi:hypothetical protein AAVH_26647 [Aphelenchoides avenae]|nr:hypothetical protein AAVH_26647 [Aphelenchus avenae]
MGSYDYNWFHIGLRRPDAGAAWQWTDGTPVDFVNWAPGYGYEPDDTTARLDVFGRDEFNYGAKDSFWLSDSPNAASVLMGICELTP